MTSAFIILMLPDETALPIVSGSFVPWNAKERVLFALEEIKRASAEGVFEPAFHFLGQVGTALQHVFWRYPTGPFGFSSNLGDAFPREPLPPDTNAVTDGRASGLDEIELTLVCVDDNRAPRLARLIWHDGRGPLIEIDADFEVAAAIRWAAPRWPINLPRAAAMKPASSPHSMSRRRLSAGECSGQRRTMRRRLKIRPRAPRPRPVPAWPRRSIRSSRASP